MLHALSERLTTLVNRRGFLNSATTAAGAIALALLGAKPAYGYAINGCNLCFNPSTCTYGGCACEWSWIGTVNNGDGTCDHYLCKECYTSSVCPGAGPNCSGAKCSTSVYSNTTNCGGGCLGPVPGPDCPCGHKPC